MSSHGRHRYRPRPAVRGPRRRCIGTTAYIATGALQTAGVIKLLDGETDKVGLRVGMKAFGHRYLLGFLEERGLARANVTTL